MRKLWFSLAVITIAGLLALGAAACDDDSSGGDETPAATDVSGEDTPQANDGGTVGISLVEFELVPDATSVAAGSITFNATNLGVEPHEVVVIRTDLDPATLPTGDDGAVDENADGVEVLGEIDEFMSDAGEQTLTLDLEAGAYALICNIVEEEEDGTFESHYGEGMFAPLEITG